MRNVIGGDYQWRGLIQRHGGFARRACTAYAAGSSSAALPADLSDSRAIEANVGASA